MFDRPNITAAIYVPVGIPERDQNAKMAELRQYALRMGWKVLEYRERQGRLGTRPVLFQLLYRLRRHEFDLVLVQSVDCFARSLEDLSEHLARLDREYIGFVAVGDDIKIDPATEAGQSCLRTLTFWAKVGRNMIARNLRTGVAKAQSKGVHCGRPRRRSAREEAQKLRAEGLSLRAIAAKLGIPASKVADALRR